MTCHRALSVAGLDACRVLNEEEPTNFEADAPSLQSRDVRYEWRKQMATFFDLMPSRMAPEVVQKLAGQAGISATGAIHATDAIVPPALICQLSALWPPIVPQSHPEI